MGLKRIAASEFSLQLNKILSDYSEEVQEKVFAEAKDCAESCKKSIRSDARSLFNGKDYANGWTYKADRSRWGITCTIYNKDRYQLTHLLEFGHEKWLWGEPAEGRVDGHEHIGPNANFWSDVFENRCTMALRGDL